MPLTDDEIQMLTALTVRCRPLHAPRWDAAGTRAAIAKVRNRSLPVVMRAAAAAAANPKHFTPAIIALPGPHWAGGDADIPHVAPPLAELCSDCGIRQGHGHPEDHLFRSLKGKPVETGYGSEAAARARAAARASVEATRRAGVAKGPAAGAGSVS